jgi:hypothetical protein
MTTKQIANQSTDGGGNTADNADVASRQEVESVSRDLLAKARYDAFRLMTEARGEAETILDEARAEATGTLTAARISAEATATKAKSDADATKLAAIEDAAAIVASAHRTAGEQSQPENSVALKDEHRALSERVSTLRTIADQLEDRFTALAMTAGTSPARAADASADATRRNPVPVLDDSPSVPTTANDEVAAAPVERDIERDSFYNRRSAKLPHLGEDGGRSALAMTRMFRESRGE